MPFGCGGSLSSRLSESRRLVYGLLCDGVARWGAPVRHFAVPVKHFALLALPVPNVRISIWRRCYLPGKSLFLRRLDFPCRENEFSYRRDEPSATQMGFLTVIGIYRLGELSIQLGWHGYPAYLPVGLSMVAIHGHARTISPKCRLVGNPVSLARGNAKL